VRIEGKQKTGRLGAPVSQICALSVFPSTLIERVANSTPIVDLVSRLNSLRVNRESTWEEGVNGRILTRMLSEHTISIHVTVHVSSSKMEGWEDTDDFPTPESPIRTTWAVAFG
jgi:hypothetical protein